jgi:copper type II ascorbate-dependent monooxygenase-like protein
MRPIASPPPPHSTPLRRTTVWLASVMGALALSACTEKPREPSPALPDVCADTRGAQREVTWYRDVKPVIDAKCAGCHQEGGIAPFPLTTTEQVQGMKSAILHSVCERSMPPWSAHRDCNQYEHERSLSDEQIALIRDWVRAGAPLGDASDAPAETPPDRAQLSRVDLELAMNEPYTPREHPDEYRCFMLDWPETEEKFITGIGVRPGKTELVHHVLVAAVAPEILDAYLQADEADPGPGFSCPGGPNPPNGPQGSRGALIGGWAPGGEGRDLPAGTGIRIQPGSKLVMQLHYNTSSAPPSPDRSRLLLKLDGAVEHEAFLFPFTNPEWIRDKKMSIPQGESDFVHIFGYDALDFASRVSKQKIRANAPISVYGAQLHMHQRGTRTVLTVEKGDKEQACLLEIPEWNFHWQGVHYLRQPVRVSPGDALRIECHWNNAGFTPHHGDPLPAVSGLNWGEGTNDEMCVAFLYATQE